MLIPNLSILLAERRLTISKAAQDTGISRTTLTALTSRSARGIQFDTLFTNGLYFEISRHAIEMAEKLKALLREKGYTFHLESPTNQQFVVLENAHMAELAKKVRFCFWENTDAQHTAVRFATSWSTTEKDIAELAKIL